MLRFFLRPPRSLLRLSLPGVKSIFRLFEVSRAPSSVTSEGSSTRLRFGVADVARGGLSRGMSAMLDVVSYDRLL